MKKSVLTYEKAIERLDEIVRQIEQNLLSVDELSECIKEAKTLTEFCKKRLTQVEDDIKTILDEGENGNNL